MSNYDGKIELPQMYGEERYLSSDKSDSYLWLAEENTKQAKQIAHLQEQLKEANELIKIVTPLFSFGSEKVDAEFSNFKRYLIRWGVK